MSLLGGPLPNKKKKAKRDSIGRKKRPKSKSSMSRLGLNTSAPKQTQKDKDDARKESELASVLKNKPKGGYSKSNTKDPGPGEKREKFVPSKKKTKQKKSEMNKEDWLKATRNSPAAKSGVFSPEERWAQQQKHRAWKASRGKKK